MTLNDLADQFSLPLPEKRPRYDRDSFLISDSNMTAWQSAQAWLASDEFGLIICGPEGSGKTHLINILADEYNGNVEFISSFEKDTSADAAIAIIDNLPFGDPKELLALLEAQLESSKRVLLAGRGRPGEWAKGLKDLRTRLEAMARATLAEPDERLIKALIVKEFKARQLNVPKNVIDYAAPRLPLTFSAAHAFVSYADKTALARKRKITVPLIQEFIERLSNQSSA